MKYLCGLFLVGLLAFSAPAQKFAEADLIVSGVAGGTPYSAVVKKLGKPPRETELDDEIDECTGGRGKILFYDGFEITMMGDEIGKNLTVLDMKITSPKWTTSNGIKIGSSAAEVMAKYGKTKYEDAYQRPTEEKIFTGEKWLVYNTKKNGPGAVTFYFAGDRLVRVELKATTC